MMDKLRKARGRVIAIKIILSIIAVALFCWFIVWALQEIGVAFAASWKKLPVYIPKIK